MFANAQYEIFDGFSLIGGIRWNQETKDAAVTYIVGRPACSVVAGTCPTGTQPFNPATETNGFTDDVRFRNVSPKVGAQYEWGNSQVYGHWSRGFRSGGYNFRITNIPVFNRAFNATRSLGFDEEQVDNYEIGGKFQTVDQSLTLNVAAYVTKVGNMQREVNLADPGAGVVQNILNTADATIKGFEAEARMRVSESLAFTANIGITDAGYDRVLFDISGDGFITDADLDLSLPRVPPVTVGVGFIHDWDLGNSGAILTRVNYQYRDRAAYTDDNFGWLNDLSNMEANITWTTPVDGLSLSLYGRNLFDQVQEGGDTQVPFGGPRSDGVQQPFQQRPGAGTFSPLMRGRNIGVEALFEF
ncbi:TonB-dependent receptor [Porphyrobacter sp. ULC335]|uniref:TonB-dependent receptor domain-containing protein n=1 Tax=Porphyrobacter sp. ULC335 TaxID=2854260 RepID=UPI00221EEC35|nr:TonB-dependent receptor [Porphyrobacter sp. ULC335]